MTKGDDDRYDLQFIITLSHGSRASNEQFQCSEEDLSLHCLIPSLRTDFFYVPEMCLHFYICTHSFLSLCFLPRAFLHKNGPIDRESSRLFLAHG